MPVRLHHIVIDADDLPSLARFWAQALGWRILSEREREVVIGSDETAPVGMCFMPVPRARVPSTWPGCCRRCRGSSWRAGVAHQPSDDNARP